MSFIVAHEVIGALPAARVHFVLHGVLGSGQNLRRLARDLHGERPGHAFVLVDLRGHGKSRGAPPPHTLQACAEDLRILRDTVGQPPTTVIGHSFGGKVALEYLRLEEESAASAQSETAPRQIWMLDSNPGGQNVDAAHEVLTVLRAVKAVPMPSPDRATVVRRLTEQGISPATGRWLATNLLKVPQGYGWALEVGVIEAMLSDYFARDLFGYLQTRRGQAEIHLVIAERSDRWDASTRARATSLPVTSRMHVHVLENAGHWLHVDNPSGLRDLMTRHLPA